jgi:hypothetical protein
MLFHLGALVFNNKRKKDHHETKERRTKRQKTTATMVDSSNANSNNVIIKLGLIKKSGRKWMRKLTAARLELDRPRKV